MMTWEAACELLELAEDHDLADVQPAFRFAARRWHPDSSGTPDTEGHFSRACEAKDRLTVLRDHHDDDPRPTEPQTADTADDATESPPDQDVAEFDWRDWLISKLNLRVRRQGLYRRDHNGIATVWAVRVQWTDTLQREEEVTRFEFPSNAEPFWYHHFVVCLGPPKRVRPRRKRKRRATGNG
jgi:hypothetical protein